MKRFRGDLYPDRGVRPLAGFLILAGVLAASPPALASHTGPSHVDGELGQWGHHPTRNAEITPFAAAHLNYYGGKVISNVKVVMVVYGAGTYIAEISGTTMSGFYTGITNSPYMDWLTEYNTNVTAKNGSPGTNQTIGRGTFLGKFVITPAAANNNATITDVQIQTELSAQITAGTLPAPDDNTVYMIHFPTGKTVTMGTNASCVQFCAYHGTYVRNTQNVYYGVLPDVSAGGCQLGCGAGTVFANQCSVASHELIEAITDAEVGLGTIVGPPLAWYDTTLGEISDICNAQQATIVGGNGISYTVQKNWSNVANACVAQRTLPVAKGDFSGDAKADIVWRNYGDGQNALWYMSGATVTGSAAFNSAPVNWSIVGTGDFNNDGHPDIVWRNTVTGENALWYMNGNVVLSGAAFPGATPDWSIVGVGDFNGDTKPDIVWHNTVNGSNAVWYMNNAIVLGGGGFPGTTTDWSIVGVGDFNGDTKPDIVWRNTVNGSNAVWYMNGLGVTGGGSFAGAPTNWVIGGVGDLNGDTKPDIIWRNVITGENAVWFMNGLNVQYGGAFDGAPTGWSMAGPR